MTVNKKSLQWDQYWSLGNITSLSDAFDGNYEGAIASFWKNRLRFLSNNTRILDICTGNGAVALFAAQIALECDFHFEIHGIDMADIHPEHILEAHPEMAAQLQEIRFHPRTAVEKQPFNNNSFDLIVGQFALEYCDVDRAIPELARLLDENGSMVFIIHHKESEILKVARSELDQAHILFDELDLFSRARSLVMALDSQSVKAKRANTKNRYLEKEQKKLNDALMTIKQKADKYADARFMLRAANHVVTLFRDNMALSRTQKFDYLQQCENHFRGNKERLLDLYRAGFDDAKCIHLRKVCDQAGLHGTDCVQFHNESGKLLGWKMSVHATRGPH